MSVGAVDRTHDDDRAPPTLGRRCADGCHREAAVPALVAARDLFDRFQAMVRHRNGAELPRWLEQASSSLLASFAAGLRTDHAAVAAALTEPWSNGQTEGQITKLKLVKRQMYVRAKLDLLRARLLCAAEHVA